MDFRILGPLQVLDEGRAVALSGSKQRALLALFLVHANETLATDRLIDELWGERSPRAAAKGLQMHISRLRKALAAGTGRDVIVTREGGYELRVRREQLDSLEFTRLCKEGRSALAAGRPEPAVEILEQALSLWRGAPLADLAYETSAQSEIARLEEMRVDALEHLIEAKLLLGRQAEVIVQLESLIAEHPYRERMRAQLMLALYRCERQADALQAYQDARRQMVAELGIEPGEALRELERKILAQDPTLAGPMPATDGVKAASSTKDRLRASARAMPEGTVTVLFSDLVGSTELLERLGDDAGGRLRRQYLRLLRRAVTRNRGRNVKDLGDGLMAVFTSASDAVNSAVAMQHAIERQNRRDRDNELRVRIGLSVGEPICEEDDYFGVPVVVAKRLCDYAEGGQIVASELVRLLVGRRGDHGFLALGALPLKGLAEPVAAVEVAWRVRGEEEHTVPLPAGIGDISPFGFVGRVQEQRRLHDLFEQASDGDCCVALLSGEPGIGKTRLAAHVASDARSRGAVALYGRSDEDLPLPHGPWVDALSHYLRHAPEDVLHAHVERHGGELMRLVPALADRVPTVPQPRDSDPDTQRYLLWEAVVGLLREAADAEPIVLVLDDLHWADHQSLLLLKHLVARGQGLHVLVIGTYRESELAHGPLRDALADLHGDKGIERLPLTGLGEAEIAEMVERAAGSAFGQAGRRISSELFRETDGNPFYTGEFLRHLLDSDAVRHPAGAHWTPEAGLFARGSPPGLREVVSRRVARLGEHATDVLSVAAVIGRDFDTDLLLRVCAHAEDDLLELLERAVGALVLVESLDVPGRFAFAHALINHTLYGSLGTTRRARVHRRVAEALEELGGASRGMRIPELAHHWARAAGPISRDRAATYARLAAERALSQLAPDEALRWFQQALALQDHDGPAEPVERCRALVGLGEAQRQLGEAAFRETLLEASNLAYELGNAALAARAAIANNRGLPSAFGGVDDERLAALERALELDRLANPARCARLISLQAIELSFDFDHERRRALAEEALALAREVGDPPTLARVLHDYVFAVSAPDTLEIRRALIPELREQARLANDPALEFFAAGGDVHISVESGALEQVDKAARLAYDIAEGLHQPSLRWLSRNIAAGLALLHGDLERAERIAEEGFRIGSAAGEPDASMVYGAQLFAVRVAQGRGEEIVEPTRALVDATPRMPAWRAGLAYVYCWVGRTSEAAAILEHAAEDRFAHVPNDEHRLMTLACYAVAAAETGARDAAAVLYELMEPWRDQIVWNQATTSGRVRTFLGLLAATVGWDERADDHFAIACEIQERNRMDLWAADAHLRWAEALARRGEDHRAATEATRSLSLARQGGYGAIEQRAQPLVERVRA